MTRLIVLDSEKITESLKSYYLDKGLVPDYLVKEIIPDVSVVYSEDYEKLSLLESNLEEKICVLRESVIDEMSKLKTGLDIDSLCNKIKDEFLSEFTESRRKEIIEFATQVANNNRKNLESYIDERFDEKITVMKKLLDLLCKAVSKDLSSLRGKEWNTQNQCYQILQSTSL